MLPLRYPVAAAILVVTICLFIGLAIRAWRSRANDQKALFSAPLQELSGTALVTAKAHYVATTFTDLPLERVNAYGLGIRGRARIKVGKPGLLIERQGERDLAIESDKIETISRATATLDRAVESDGLIQVNWVHDEQKLSTFLRIVSRAEQQDFFEKFDFVNTKEEAK